VLGGDPLNSDHRGVLESQYDWAATAARSVSPALVRWVQLMRDAKTYISAVTPAVMRLLQDRAVRRSIVLAAIRAADDEG